MGDEKDPNIVSSAEFWAIDFLSDLAVFVEEEGGDCKLETEGCFNSDKIFS